MRENSSPPPSLNKEDGGGAGEGVGSSGTGMGACTCSMRVGRQGDIILMDNLIGALIIGISA